MKLRSYGNLLIASLLIASLSACMDDDDSDYAEWKISNEEYVKEAETQTENGKLKFEKITPSWAPATFALVRWCNDRSLTAKNLSPLDNSTIDMTYETADINGKVINSSYDLHTYGDSIYRTRPADMITGVRAVLPLMHVGDSVALVLPYSAAYGTTAYGSIPPYSTLLFKIKLVGIHAYEISND
ncbi:MAG: FKBP-type peptidyl-prolyl cis-trans isomerase [Muribaculaceae bacterium]|nr:FKBP-type peptidyl-prolyl cis-trans isomerase [Muribaculaceae bacterium]